MNGFFIGNECIAINKNSFFAFTLIPPFNKEGAKKSSEKVQNY